MLLGEIYVHVLEKLNIRGTWQRHNDPDELQTLQQIATVAV